ncbi:MAG: formyltransferase family protein [Bacteroidales bacterium]
MDRIVIFIDSNLVFSRELLRAFLKEFQSRADMAVAAVMETGTLYPGRMLKQGLIWLIDGLFNPGNHVPVPSSHASLKRLCRRYGIPVLVSAEDDFKQNGFYDFLKDDLKVNLAVSLGCLRIYPPALIKLFDMVVNYHNGLLPAYRGIAATSWSVYYGENRTGFAFHRMTEGIDEGNILASDSIPADPNVSIRKLENIKTRCALQHCGNVVDKMKHRDPGVPQMGTGNYFSLRDFLEIRRVGDPSRISWSELQRKIHCFRMAILDINRKSLPVTSVSRQKGVPQSHFVTKDGVAFRVRRCFYLPYPLYWLAKKANLAP